MTTIGLALADADAYTSQMGLPKAAPVSPGNMETRLFSAAMQKAMAEAAPGPAASNEVTGVPQATMDGAKGATADAQERARRGLGLEAPHAPPSTQGDAILNGIQNIRGVFDAHQQNIKSLVTQPAASTTTLMAMQMEVTNFSLLCTITSELAGKSTQTFETLLKGQ